MDCQANRLPYRQTNSFSKTVLDYIDQAPAIKPFFAQPPSLQGIKKAMEARKLFPNDRETLVGELKKQYRGVSTHQKVNDNITSLLSPATFTVTTAHQNNIFTGPLYFIYKIVHAIKLAEHLKNSLPDHDFVPVFYIGSEDADLEELNHIWITGEKKTWETKQQGAVGRMKVDKELIKLIASIEGQLAVLPYGSEIINDLREFYKEGVTIQDATFYLVNKLFGAYGLVVLLPDNTALKKQMVTVFQDDLLHQTASGIVEDTAAKLTKAGYKVQANPREINLFYLENDLRERIEKVKDQFTIHDSPLTFDRNQLLEVLQQHPGRFSPNVILRGLYQETILPNIAFIGGGGEMAYWLQLKDLFDHYKIPFPVLVLRNSFLLLEKKWEEKIRHLGFQVEDFFLEEQELMDKLVVRESKNDTRLNGSLTKVEELYEAFKKQARAVDSTLEKHVDSLKVNTVYRLQELEKKMLRAEKRKFTDKQRQIHTIREQLFPGNGLQERRENLLYYYAKWGRDLITRLYEHSPALEQEFVVITEK